jgi:hypothetical protein
MFSDRDPIFYAYRIWNFYSVVLFRLLVCCIMPFSILVHISKSAFRFGIILWSDRLYKMLLYLGFMREAPK